LRRFPEAATEKQGFGSSGKSAASMAAYFSDDPARILIRSFGKSAVQRLNAPIRHFTGWVDNQAIYSDNTIEELLILDRHRVIA
jgi:hypothetical protein